MRKIFIILFFLFFVLFFTSCVYEVKYSVTGTAKSVNITMTNSNGDTSQFSKVAVPWERSFRGVAGDFVYISAQNNGEEGTVITTIYKNEEIFKTSKSSGGYVISTSSGSL